MKLITEKIQSDLNILELLKLDKNDFVIFDIETTGLSAKTSSLYLIGYILYTENGFELRQLFAENYDEEQTLLNTFFDDIKDKTYLISYNGNGFDIPYITNKGLNLSKFISIDLYREVTKYKNIFKLINYKQPTIEDFLKIERKDTLNGGILIDYYKEYVISKETHLYDALLLHNHDDLIGLYDVVGILKYINTFNGDFKNVKLTDMNDHIIIEAVLPYNMPSELSFSNEHAYISISNNTLKLKTSVVCDTLKYFFENYKEYVYLPTEDNAVHISVGMYVDKAYRQKACKDNCYTKRQGRFVKQFGKLDLKSYGYDYKSRNDYVELNEDLSNEELLKEFIINHISNTK